jgi:hypothetical protein
MTKLFYLAAMALLGLGLTVAQSTSPASDSSNSSQQTQTQNTTDNKGTSSKPGRKDHTTQSKDKQNSQESVPDTTIRDQQSSPPSTSGASGQNNTNEQPATRNMGTTGSTPGVENPAPEDRRGAEPQSGSSTDQQPNSSSNPEGSTPHNMAMNTTPAARAMASHTPDPGTCMNPASLATGQDGSAAPRPSPPNCD